jgi:hypothetical protein
MLRLVPKVLVLVLVLAATFTTAAGRIEQDALGRIDFPTSQTGPAQDAFLRGVLLLHNFEYDDAREAFLEAQAAAPGFVMAFWGTASSAARSW